MNSHNRFFLNKKILIYGLGKSGISSFHFLKKNNFIYLYDDNKSLLKLKKFNKFLLKKINQNNFDYIVISPGIDINNCDLKNYLKKNQKKIITDFDIFYDCYKKNKIIAITGTNGKSTTAKLLFQVLKKEKKDVRLCGNIGRPILLEKEIDNETIFVIEASSYQIDYSKNFKANHAVILNISPDHLERHNSIKKYVYAKFKLIKNQNKNDFAYINNENKYLKKMIKKSKTLSKLIKVETKIIKKFEKKITNPYFLTKGNQENLSFIFSIAKKFNLKNENIIKTINKFKCLKFRQQIIYKSKNITLINDSKATSFSSSINILKSLQKVFWIVGGIPKRGDKFNLKKNQCKNISAYVFGKNKGFFFRQFKNKLSYYYFNNLSSAIKQVLQDVKKENENNLHKTILFSPSAASFDSFKNFEERGDYFNFLIKKYKIEKNF